METKDTYIWMTQPLFIPFLHNFNALLRLQIYSITPAFILISKSFCSLVKAVILFMNISTWKNKKKCKKKEEIEAIKISTLSFIEFIDLLASKTNMLEWQQEDNAV